MPFWNILDTDEESYYEPDDNKKCKKICKKKCKKTSSCSSESSSSSACPSPKPCKKPKCPNLLKIVKEEIYKFKLAGNTLPFSGCTEIPKIIRCYFKKIGYCKFKSIIESKPVINPESGKYDRALAINNAYSLVNNYYFKGRIYNIRLTLFFSTGLVFYDSLLLKADSSGPSNISLLSLANFSEVLRSTETRWSTMQRTITTEIPNANIPLNTSQFFAFWMPLCEMVGINNNSTPNTLTTVNPEVVCLRLSINVDSNGEPIPLLQ